MKIGIPKGLAVYEYPILYTKFFELLGIDIVFSEDTNREIIDEGISRSIDESCLASKIFIGHVYSLTKMEDIDYIFIPRLCSFNKIDTVCVKFYAMYDICRNLFQNNNFITLNIDYLRGENEFKAFINLGKRLGKKYTQIVAAYLKARNMQKIYDNKKLEKQINSTINNSLSRTNVLIVSHSYIAHDKYMGYPIIKYLQDFGTNILYADVNSIKYQRKLLNNKNKYKGTYNDYTDISKNIYWKFSKNLLNGISEYIDKVDGIIYLTVFPCGPDSLVNELAIRKVIDKPSINIIIDEQDANTGLYTRLESFIDILEQNKLTQMNNISESVV